MHTPFTRALALTAILGACASGHSTSSPLGTSPTVAVWVTTGDQSRLLAREPDLHFTSAAVDSSIPVIQVDYKLEFQSVVGWGAAMTDAAAYLIQTKLSAAQREGLLQELFGHEPGIGLSFVRIPMGASDFSRSHYSYDDRPAGEVDSTLAHFSIDVDRAEKIPALKRALDENYGPHLGGCGNCRGVVTIHSATGEITRNPEYYALAHASRFVRPGAVRIGSSVPSGLETVAFRNPDRGSTALIVLNTTASSSQFAVRVGAMSFRTSLPSGAVATFTGSDR